MRFFRIVAVISLVADAYIVLALIAIQRMQRAYVHFLPLLGREDLQIVPRSLWLGIVIWTAILAVGCLWFRGDAQTGEKAR